MSNILAIAQKEIRSYFASPIAYVVIGLFALLFGATAEVGVFEMLEHGLSEVNNPSEAFLAERMVNAAGSAIAVTMAVSSSLVGA